MSSWLLVAVGLAALVVGAELLVRGGARLAARLGIPPVIIGLTVVSIGTSTPELAVGVDAARQGAGSLAVGAVAGTNIVNLLLILGLSAAIRPLALRAQTFRFDLPAMVVAAVVLVAMAQDRELSTADGAVLLAMAVGYTAVIVVLGARESAAIRAEFEAEYAAPPRLDALREVTVEVVALLGGIAVVALGADWLVDGAATTARDLGVSEAVIGLTIVGIGTSAPELVTTVVSTVRGERDIAIGNLIGSSVYNIALILGVSAVVAPIAVNDTLVRVDLPLMAAAVLLCVPVFVSGRVVSRREGVVFVAAYVGYLTYLLVART